MHPIIYCIYTVNILVQESTLVGVVTIRRLLKGQRERKKNGATRSLQCIAMPRAEGVSCSLGLLITIVCVCMCSCEGIYVCVCKNVYIGTVVYICFTVFANLQCYVGTYITMV